MKIIDINKWNRKQHFEHFMSMQDPYFAVTIPVDVSRAYVWSKTSNVSFFARYLHDCMLAINAIDNFRYRLLDGRVVEFDNIHASATIMRADNTFGFSRIEYSRDLKKFSRNLEAEKYRIQNSSDLFPQINGLDCIYCSVLPWFNFSGHKEPVSAENNSVPKLAFGKTYSQGNKVMMNLAINVNHALVDGYHVGLFSQAFQDNLNAFETSA